MGDALLQHTALNSRQAYCDALDALCTLANHKLYFFEQNFDNTGFNAVARYETLRQFLLANPANRLFLLAHDSHYLATRCARITLLLEQFSGSMFIYQTPKNLRHLSEPFAVADSEHYVRRFHFDDARGIFAQHDPSIAHAYQSRFLEMWASSHNAVSLSRLGL